MSSAAKPLTPEHSSIPTIPWEDEFMQGRERLGRIVAALILDLDPIPP